MRHLLAGLAPWLIALAWWWKVLAAWRGLPRVPNLLHATLEPTDALPSLAVIVPARNEQADIAACLRSLLAQDVPELRIVAVNDRSTDSTGEQMDALAAAHPDRLTVLHVAALPAGWLGKTHAMHLGAAAAGDPDYLLFTDADVLFAPHALRLALSHAESVRADHLVLVPTPIIRRWDEAALLAFFQLFGLWGARPWMVERPQARDAIGIGAFNLVRTAAYRQIGGFAALPMAVVEDLTLARRIKRDGLRQRIAFGRGLVRVHWASGMRGLVRTMTKNIFAIFNYHVPLLAIGLLWLATFCVLPFAWLGLPGTLLPAVLTIAAMTWAYRMMSHASGLSTWNVLLAPLAGTVFLYALLRSMVVTLWQGGIVWRGTFYPLAELRRHNEPLLPPRVR